MALRVADDVRVDAERDARIRVAQLRLRHGNRRTRLHQHAGVKVPERVQTAPRDLQRIEDRPEPMLHNVV